MKSFKRTKITKEQKKIIKNEMKKWKKGYTND